MVFSKVVRFLVVSVAIMGMLFPPSLWADSPSTRGVDQVQAHSNWLIKDVALDGTGTLKGRYLNDQSTRLGGQTIRLLRNQELLAETTTDDRGNFSFANLRGSVYNLQLGEHSTVCRCWTSATAPPHALHEAVVSTQDVVRGQSHPLARGLSNPWIITGIALVAVAIPVALHNHRNDRTAASE